MDGMVENPWVYRQIAALEYTAVRRKRPQGSARLDLPCGTVPEVPLRLELQRKPSSESKVESRKDLAQILVGPKMEIEMMVVAMVTQMERLQLTLVMAL